MWACSFKIEYDTIEIIQKEEDDYNSYYNSSESDESEEEEKEEIQTYIPKTYHYDKNITISSNYDDKINLEKHINQLVDDISRRYFSSVQEKFRNLLPRYSYPCYERITGDVKIYNIHYFQQTEDDFQSSYYKLDKNNDGILYKCPKYGFEHFTKKCKSCNQTPLCQCSDDFNKECEKCNRIGFITMHERMDEYNKAAARLQSFSSFKPINKPYDDTKLKS